MLLQMSRHAWFTALMLSIAALTGCPGDHDHDGDEHDGGHGHEEEDASHHHDSCGLIENCKDTVTLADGLEVAGEAGHFTVEVVSFDPLAVEGNSIVVKVSDADGKQVEDAEVTQDVFSVDCMHGGPVAPQTLTADADGLYEAKPHHLHGGPWDTTFEISADGKTDTVKIHLCVPEAGDAG